MDDNIIPFPRGVGDHTRDPKTVEAKPIVERLREAEEIEARLGPRIKLEPGDAQRFALNLGKMIKTVEQQCSLSDRKIIMDCFGEKSGPPITKKRQMLWLYEGEEEKHPRQYKTPDKYRDLAKYLSKKINAPKDFSTVDREKLALLRMVEGSSFDSSSAHIDREHSEVVNELEKNLKTLVDRVTHRVDMGWVYRWTRAHPVFAQGFTGFAETLHAAESRTYTNCTLDIEGDLENMLAPCVRIGSVYSPFYWAGCLRVKIKKDNARLPSDILTAWLKEEFGPDSWPGNKAMEKHPNYVENQDGSLVGYVRRLIDLEIRYDQTSDDWKPIIMLRGEVKDGIGSVEPPVGLYAGILKSRRWKNSQEHVIALDYDIDGDCTIASKLEETSDEETYAVFWHYGALSFELLYDGVLEFKSYQGEVGLLPGEDFYRFLLSDEFDDCNSLELDILKSENGESITGYTPAPVDTLAHALLLNFAYAPPSKRIDSLILEDALRKYKLVRSLYEKGEAQYKEAMCRQEELRGSED